MLGVDKRNLDGRGKTAFDSYKWAPGVPPDASTDVRHHLFLEKLGMLLQLGERGEGSRERRGEKGRSH